MKRYNALENSYGEHKVKYTLQCGTCRGSFTIQLHGYRKGAGVMFTDIFETLLDESDLERMEFDHLRLRFDDDGLIIAFLNNEGEEVMAIDQYWNDIDREQLIVGIEIVDFEEDSKEKKCQRCSNTFTESKGNYMYKVNYKYCDDCRRLIFSPSPPTTEELTDTVVGQTRADISKMETVVAKNAHTEEVVVSKKEIATDEKVDIVSHPAHYTIGTIEPKDFIRDQWLNFNRGNVIKYTVRAGRKNKNKEVEDLKKAKQYLEFEIEYLEGKK